MVNRMPVTTPEKRREVAQRMIERFSDNFSMVYRGQAHLQLARYAAVPLVLTPELVNHLRSRFLRKVPWIAEADLLLSDLCSPVGYEQYVMDADVRSCLVDELEEQSPQAVERVAYDLIRYVKYLQKTNRYLTDNEQKRQQWSAMGFISEQRSQLAKELLLEFDRSIAGLTGEVGGEGVSRADLSWLVDVTKDLAPRLKDYRNLIEVCERVSRVLQDARSREQTGLAQLLQERFGVETEEPTSTIDDALSGLQEFEYEIAEYVEEDVPSGELQTFEFDVLTLQQEKEDEQEATSDPLAALNWRRISFAVATLDQQNRISTRQAAAWEYAEEIQFELTGKSSSATISLEMVAIPGGDFQMGSKDESTEQPIHVVKVQPFFMGKYPVTQAQWQAVAKLPKIYQSLQSNPSRFKGDDRPIENISWHDAIEFCARLSKHTAREYRLPTEAEWEYACRAGTTTQYHFGDELTNELANYSSANSGTTPAGKFLYTNAFGLYDMHGNVWEWCMDCWHENYEKAPIDGSAWLDEDAPKNARRVLRGGSWFNNPRYCRSASRYRSRAGYRNDNIGFRILSPARTLP
jgi:formylglycine-generating enzyme required for sulfatase activity